MKIAILADIHGNLPAMQAVANHIERRQPDHVVIAGDLVNRGPRSPECLQLALEKQRNEGWHIISGNHEDYLTSLAAKNGNQSPIEVDFYQPIRWVCHQLRNHIEILKRLPDQFSQTTPSGDDWLVTHGSSLGKRQGIFPRMTDAEIRKRIKPFPALFCVGHTHVPLIRQIDDTLVVNAGSAGLPFDGDTRAAYVQTELTNRGWQAEIIRVPYNIGQAERDFHTSGFSPGGGPITRLMLYELRHAKSLLYPWTAKFQAAIFAGDITVADSVTRFMVDYSD